jgi:HK97 family phage major capsid protein
MKHTNPRLMAGASKLALRAPEVKDANDDAILKDVKKTVEGFMSAFEEFKSTNDQRLKEIDKKGVADPTTLAKLEKIEKDMAKGEELSAKLLKLEQETKAARDQAEETDKLIAKLEAKLSRPGVGNAEEKAAVLKKKVNDWGRAVVYAHTLGVANLSADQQKVLADVTAEYKALSITPDTAGGYLAPVEYVHEIIKAKPW